MDTIRSLSSIPILESHLDVSDSILNYVKSLNYVRDLNYTTTSDKNILDHDEMFDIYSQITKKVYKFFYDVCGISDSVFPEITSSWINIHSKGDFAQTHSHCNSIITGVWYIKTSPNCGNLSLQSNRFLFGNTFNFDFKELNEFNTFEAQVEPNIGSLYIFPSTTQHSVGINLSDEDRISLAFNYFVRGSIKAEGKEIAL